MSGFRPARVGDLQDEAARARLVARARRQRADIAQYFTDVESYNDSLRERGEEPIDPDPDGTMSCLIAYLDDLLKGEALR